MNQLREIRKQKGITQFELSKVIDVHPQRISEVEHGKADLRFQEAVKAANYLQVSLDELAGRKKEPATIDIARVGMMPK